jgi:Rhodanese-related sulfurtransferase
MKKILMRCILLLLFVNVLLMGCGKENNPTINREEDNKITPTITSEELKRSYEANPRMIIIDLRTKQEYQDGHIQGAVQVDMEDLSALAIQGLQDKGVKIVIYSESRKKSQEGMEILESLKYENVDSLGSVHDWKYDFIKDKK